MDTITVAMLAIVIIAVPKTFALILHTNQSIFYLTMSDVAILKNQEANVSDLN
jgi:hypothetical protein